MRSWLKSLPTLKFWQASLALLLLAGAGSGAYYGVDSWLGRPKTTAVTGQLIPVAYRDITQTLRVAGTLSYYNVQQLTFGAAGTIKDIKASEGTIVAKGDVLATFDDASVRNLQKAILQAQTALATAKTNLDNARHPYTDADIASAQSAMINAQAAVATAQTNLDKAKNPYTDADIASVQIAVINAQAAVATAQANLDKAIHP
jgi:multidrug efflux pump subunit AcrA (membrane-fusion protein)